MSQEKLHVSKPMNLDKRREKGIVRRRSIIEAAIHCIASRGLCDTTLDRVAELAGVSRALVVFHFKSKNGMLQAVLEQIGSQYDRDWKQIMVLPGLSADQRLLKLISYDLKLPDNNPELIAVWYTFWGEAKGLYRQLNSFRDETYDNDFKKLIELIKQSGNYEQIKSDYVCSALSTMLLGMWLHAHLNPGPANFEKNLNVTRYFLKLNFPNHF